MLETDKKKKEPYAIVTNGVELQAYKYNQETHVYDQLSAAPSYEEMLGRAALMFQPEAPMPRPAYESLFCEKTQEQNDKKNGLNVGLNTYCCTVQMGVLMRSHTLIS